MVPLNAIAAGAPMPQATAQAAGAWVPQAAVQAAMQAAAPVNVEQKVFQVYATTALVMGLVGVAGLVAAEVGLAATALSLCMNHPIMMWLGSVILITDLNVKIAWAQHLMVKMGLGAICIMALGTVLSSLLLVNSSYFALSIAIPMTVAGVLALLTKCFGNSFLQHQDKIVKRMKALRFISCFYLIYMGVSSLYVFETCLILGIATVTEWIIKRGGIQVQEDIRHLLPDVHEINYAIVSVGWAIGATALTAIIASWWTGYGIFAKS